MRPTLSPQRRVALWWNASRARHLGSLAQAVTPTPAAARQTPARHAHRTCTLTPLPRDPTPPLPTLCPQEYSAVLLSFESGVEGGEGAGPPSCEVTSGLRADPTGTVLLPPLAAMLLTLPTGQCPPPSLFPRSDTPPCRNNHIRASRPAQQESCKFCSLGA